MSLAGELAAGIAALDLDVAPDAQQRMLDYLALVEKWNKAYNLTAVRDPSQMVVQHLLDSLAAVPAFDGARRVLDDGRAWTKFQAICEAQCGLRQPPDAAQTHEVTAPDSGEIVAIDNRRLARLAKLAGAPGNLAAGLTLAVRAGETVERGQPLFRLHAASQGEIAYAIEYWSRAPAITVSR